MERYNKAEILRRVEEEDVEFIRLQFTDMFGMIKNITKLILWTDRRNTFYERIHS